VHNYIIYYHKKGGALVLLSAEMVGGAVMKKTENTNISLFFRVVERNTWGT